MHRNLHPQLCPLVPQKQAMRFRIRLSYNGAGFHGWQIQPRDPSVQEHIEKALSMLLKEEIPFLGRVSQKSHVVRDIGLPAGISYLAD